MDEPEIWTTDDLAFATFLTLQGHDIQEMEWSDGTCEFKFLIEDNFMNDVIDYTGGLARVDPKEFMTSFNRTKRRILNDPRRTTARA